MKRMIFTVCVVLGLSFSLFGEEFKIIAKSDPKVTTHPLVSGNLTIGITDNGGGIINQVIIPGYGDIMGPITDMYGRAGQVAIRDGAHGGRFNPTQAGFNETLGTKCAISATANKLIVEPRGMALWHGDGKYDFTQWENIGSDPYNADGGNSDVDELDESNLEGKQLTEVHSGFDYYGTYENYLGKNGIRTAAIRHYFEISYIRPPGHCINQFREGTALWNANQANLDISRLQPEGEHKGTDKDMTRMIAVWSLRHDLAKWSQKYVYYRKHDNTWKRQAAAIDLSDEADQSVFILADSNNPTQGKALGLYRPNTDINNFTVIGKNEQTNEIVYKDHRLFSNYGTNITYALKRIPTMSKYGFLSRITGMINRTRLDADVYEAYRSEFYILYGTPQEIMDAVKTIDEVEIATGVSDIETPTKDNFVNVYPNPASDGVFHLEQPQKYAVFSLQGIKVLEGEGRLIDLSSQAKGMYVLITDGKTQKLVCS